MGIERVVYVQCDYESCTNGKDKKPCLLSWNETQVEAGKTESPEEAKYLVISGHNGKPKTFCCQLCAASYFLPPGYDIMRKKVETLPVAIVDGPVAQPDGAGPEDCPDCNHAVHLHNGWGCTQVMSNEPGDFCRCDKTYPKRS